MSFDHNLYQLLAQDGKNLFFSPFSVRFALTLAAAGARGQTAREMAHVLEFGRSDATTRVPFLKGLGEQMGSDGTLRVANRLWAQEGFVFDPDFLRLLSGDGIELVDFYDHAEEVRQEINKWVALHTKEKIKNLLGEGSLDSHVKLVITNALYFYANWVSRFDVANTRSGDFFLDNRWTVSAPLMRQEDRFCFAELENFSVLEMPYLGGQKSMLVLLPNQREGLTHLAALPEPSSLRQAMHPKRVQITFPKFRINWGTVNLAYTLAEMGMGSAFDRRADFGGMEPTGSLCISGVYHKAYVSVDEAGTEAAAATAEVMRSKGVSLEQVYEFRADHPFIFWILHGDKVLFMGRLTDPTA